MDADFAAHQPHQIAADRQPQPGAAEIARDRGIGLGERVETRASLSGAMPMPLSRTVKRSRSGRSCAELRWTPSVTEPRWVA